MKTADVASTLCWCYGLNGLIFRHPLHAIIAPKILPTRVSLIDIAVLTLRHAQLFKHFTFCEIQLLSHALTLPNWQQSYDWMSIHQISLWESDNLSTP